MKAQIVKLPKFVDIRGNLSFVENATLLPFVIKRTYWIYDVPGGEARGGHAYKQNQEFVIALSGSFDVLLDDGEQQQRYALNRSYFGLYIPGGVWREMSNFSTNAVALILSSTGYCEEDYIRDYNDYKIWCNARR